MKGYHLDPHPSANFAGEHYAVITAPRRKRKRTLRDRCPETNVKVVENKDSAINLAETDENLYAAKVMGPARSSEGCNIYYIIDVF